MAICDRFALSTLIYGAAQGLDPEWLEEINARFPTPDLTIITLPPYEVCMERMQRRDELDQFENEELQKKVYEEYKNIESPATIFVDTSGPKEEVAEGIWQEVQKYFGQVSREAIVELE